MRKFLVERSDAENKSTTLKLDFKKKCELLSVPRSSMYYEFKISNDDSDEVVIKKLHSIYQEHPYYGYRRMTVELNKMGFVINHKKVIRLLKSIGMKAIYPTKKTTIRNPQHKTFPYLLRNMKIDKPNKVWQVDITYIKIRGGFVYLISLIDVFSRKVMGWKLSSFLDTSSCLDALYIALQCSIPEIVNSDQGCQFTSEIWVNFLIEKKIKISMDGKDRWADNVYIERFWRTIKYELIYLHSFDTILEVRDALERYIIFYNEKRPHQSLNYHTPNEVFAKKIIPTKQELFASFAFQHIQNLGTL